MSEPMSAPDWTTDAEWANMAAEELESSLKLMGIKVVGVWADDDGHKVNVAFQSIQDAETMVSLGIPVSQRPGSLYDRVTASCVTLSALADRGEQASEEAIVEAIGNGWTWTIHPDMTGRRMAWHASVDMPVADAYRLTSNLNRVGMVEL